MVKDHNFLEEEKKFNLKLTNSKCHSSHNTRYQSTRYFCTFEFVKQFGEEDAKRIRNTIRNQMKSKTTKH